MKQPRDEPYYRGLVGDAWEQLRDTHNGDKRAFRAYCDLVLKLRTERKIQDEWAAMAIAHAMFIPNLDDDPLCEEITIIAGELEDVLPAVKKKAKWQKLEATIQELPASL